MGEKKAIFPVVVSMTPLGLDEDERKKIGDYVRENSDKFKKCARDGVNFEELPMILHHPR